LLLAFGIEKIFGVLSQENGCRIFSHREGSGEKVPFLSFELFSPVAVKEILDEDPTIEAR
jgi:hypothetical protein